MLTIRRLFRFSMIAVVLCAGGVGERARGNGPTEAIDFETQVVPILTRFGCNAGACHGAAIGRRGFKLSLFGSRPVDDQIAIVQELEGRRVNLDRPTQSLLLRKATETMEHGGGERFDDASPAYAILERWIAQGGKRLQRRQLTDLAVTPTNVLLKKTDDSVAVSVVARFDDGSTQDVTDVTSLTSDDSESVSIDRDSNRLTVHRRGEHVVIARYLDRVQAIRLGIPLGTQQLDPSTRDGRPGSVVDRWIDGKLRQLRIPASPRADDHEFARRVWLDLTGHLPSPDRLDAFVADRSDDKRRRLIDRLLKTDQFAAYWALKWANLLGIDSKSLQPEGSQAYHGWLTESFRQDSPWNASALAMLTASGDGYVDGSVNFLRSGNGPDGLAELATRVFMGVRLRCANCHDHPLDHWTQDDYHGLAAIFAKLKRGRVVSTSTRGEVTHPVTGQPALARIPGTRDLSADDDGRMEFARWVTAPSNPYFARAAVNRIWAQLMGRGLIDPVDDIRATNPASHPELLDALADEFIAGGFRFRPIIRLVCNSDAYGRTSQTRPANQSDSVYYSHFLPRGLEAEVVAGAIADVTGVDIVYGADDQRDAIRLTDNRMDSETLDILGRCDREAACETPALSSGSLAKVLHFLNGDLLNRRLDDRQGRLTKWLQTYPDDFTLMETLYKQTLSRPLNDSERRYWAEQFDLATESGGRWRDRQTRQMFFADAFWGLLTSETFLTNH
ncbi:hypothetical protein Enr13x_46920 [Stieleria neptunia]|uniref:Planctomycete cytochrome C n=1 Tax=Stieleria neptunia TaxID=2527979 RepID=A0A518HVD5_9BACT|nr:DUF1549 domain-containing protein [Stieleria neptunia]QDV44821.1 hypothetical protein Enr13x_46920 [Stieleria neptunia]